MSLTPSARTWLAEALSTAADGIRIEPMAGATSSSVYRVSAGGGTDHDAVLRLFDNAAWLTEEPDLVAGRPMKASIPPTFFDTPSDFRAWLASHHMSAQELWVGFRKVATGLPSITWPESVDQALCFGWIDGLRKRVDPGAYMIRFTPRRAGSTWSAVNIRRVAALTAAGLMQPAGLRAYEARTPEKSGIYSYETRPEALPETYAAILRMNRAAWKDFGLRSPAYRRGAIGWVIRAKTEETRLRRLSLLIDCSAKGEPIPQLDRPPVAKT